jgi:mono/diheme cytochrome c family protein
MTALLIVALVALLQAPGQPAPQPAAGNADNGKRLYMKHTCYFCHGTAGQGGVAGARVAAVARNAQGFIRYVRQPSGQMPPYTTKVVSDADLTNIYAFIASRPAPATNILLLK